MITDIKEINVNTVGEVDWDRVSLTPLPESFIREYSNYVNWRFISSNSILSEDFIREFQDKVDWGLISYAQRLSDEFLLEFKDRVVWANVSMHRRLSDDFKDRLKGSKE